MVNIWYSIIHKNISGVKPQYYLAVCTNQKDHLKFLKHLNNDSGVEKRWIIENCEEYWKDLYESVEQIRMGKIDEKTLVSKIYEIKNKIKKKEVNI